MTTEQTVGEQVDIIAEQMHQARIVAEGHDAKAVPVFGIYQSRVPDSMKADNGNWRELPEAQVEILPEYGPEHDRLVALRTELEQLKRTINTIGPFVEARMRCAAKLKNEGLSESEEVMLMTQDEDARKKRDAAFESIQRVVEKIEDTDASTSETIKSRLEAVVKEIVEKGSKDFSGKDEYAEYWGFLRHQTQKIFAEQKKLLERIKVIKRQAQQKAPAAASSVVAPAEAAPAAESDKAQDTAA